MPVADTTDYDPRYDRAQTVRGAKARYVDNERPEYGLQMLESDLERLLRGGDLPDYVRRQRETSGIAVSRYEEKCPTCGKWVPEAPCDRCETLTEPEMGYF